MSLIVDSFAGGGGASTGIEIALGRSPDVAINHDAEALAMHARNHPRTVHLVSDVWEVDPVETCNGRPDLRWPLGTVTTQDHNALVLVRSNGDIGMRHLAPRELFSAQGFPASYDIAAKTKTAQVRLAGNSVCPPMAAALVAANCAERASRAA